MRSQIAEKDVQIEEQKLNINSLEQNLFDERQKEKIINDLQVNIQAISNERDIKLNVRLFALFLYTCARNERILDVVIVKLSIMK